MRTEIRMMALALCCALAGSAAAHECSNSDFQGTYAFQGLGYDLVAGSPSPMALSGSLEADGMGGFVYWANTVSFYAPGAAGIAKTTIQNDVVADAKAGGSPVRYEVTTDCGMRISGVLATPFGPRPLEIVGGLADGGAKAKLQMGAATAVGLWTAERAAPSPMQRLLERIASRLSLRP